LPPLQRSISRIYQKTPICTPPGRRKGQGREGGKEAWKGLKGRGKKRGKGGEGKGVTGVEIEG